MIMSDVHMDSDFEYNGDEKRAECLRAFEKALGLCSGYGINYVFIPGDLFDKRCPDGECVKKALDLIAAQTETVFLLACGNHDPYAPDSPYANYKLPGNLFVFPTREISTFEFSDKSRASDREYMFSTGLSSGKKGVRVYGASFTGHFEKESLLKANDTRVRRLSTDYCNILLMHGITDPANGKSPYNPVSSDTIRQYGFDLAIIGGSHDYNKNGEIICPGCLYPRSFSDLGPKGVVLGDITPDGKIRTEFMPIDIIKYEHVNYDVTGADNFSAYAISEGIKKITEKKNCYDIDITGVINYDENVGVEAIKRELSGYYPEVRVQDKTCKKIDLKLFSSEKNMRGSACVKIRQRVIEGRKEAENGNKSSIDEKNYEDALNILVKSFEAVEKITFAEEPADEN